MKRSTGLKPISDRRLAKLAAEGVRFPSSTLLSRKPAAKRVRDTDFSPATVELILARDGWSCVRCGGRLFGARGLDYSIQHRRARGAGGTLRPDTSEPQNGIALCGSATSAGGCHEYVESHRQESRDNGWTILQTQDPLTVPVAHRLHGRVLLLADGSWVRYEEASA